MTTKEQACENGKILSYVLFVLLLVVGVFYADMIKKAVLNGISNSSDRFTSASASAQDTYEDDDGDVGGDDGGDESMTG